MTIDPVKEFTAGLLRLGTESERRRDLVIYTVEPVSGRLAGEVVQTAVEVVELTAWPVAPPHWVHLEMSVAFARTNAQPSALEGWVRHSRQIAGWGADVDPAQGWLAHVRAVVGEAL